MYLFSTGNVTKIYLFPCRKYTIVYNSFRVDFQNTIVYNIIAEVSYMGEREKQYSGMISYRKLFELMEQKNIKKRDLREKYNISPTIVNRLNNNSNVAIDTIMYLCEILNCQPGDIVEYIQDKT